MRVIAGEFRGRKLTSPPGTTTRPTTDRTREAVFNALLSMGVIDGAVVVDLFAGTGALGIEALSRGAQRCTFVERDSAALRALRSNIDMLKLAGRATVAPGDAMTIAAAVGSVDVVLADPPYGFAEWPELLGRLNAGLVVAEADRPFDAPPGWTVVRSKEYGRAHVLFLEPVPLDEP